MRSFHDDSCQSQEWFEESILKNSTFNPEKCSGVGDVDFREYIIEWRDVFLHTSSVETHSDIKNSRNGSIHDGAFSAEIIY